MTGRTKNFERQMWVVQSLADASTIRPGITIDVFRVEEWAGGHVCVVREYFPQHAPSVRYSQCFKIGPRGARTTVYDNFY